MGVIKKNNNSSTERVGKKKEASSNHSFSSVHQAETGNEFTRSALPERTAAPPSEREGNSPGTKKGLREKSKGKRATKKRVFI